MIVTWLSLVGSRLLCRCCKQLRLIAEQSVHHCLLFILSGPFVAMMDPQQLAQLHMLMTQSVREALSATTELQATLCANPQEAANVNANAAQSA